MLWDNLDGRNSCALMSTYIHTYTRWAAGAIFDGATTINKLNTSTSSLNQWMNTNEFIHYLATEKCLFTMRQIELMDQLETVIVSIRCNQTKCSRFCSLIISFYPHTHAHTHTYAISAFIFQLTYLIFKYRFKETLINWYIVSANAYTSPIFAAENIVKSIEK